MATKVEIDAQLLSEAMRLGGHRSRAATVTNALKEYIRHRKQRRVIDLFGKIDFDPAYDYKEQRRRN